MFDQLPCTSIIIPPNRQRELIDTSDLEPSIRERGVLVPIIISRDLTLIAGERRLTTCLKLGIKTIPVRYIDSLTPLEAAIIEFEENAKRKDLTWQETAKTVQQIHALIGKSQEETAKALGLSISWVGRNLMVAKELGDEKIAKLDTLASAYNLLDRKRSRRIDDALLSITSDTKEAITAALAPEEPIQESPSEDLEDISDTDFSSDLPPVKKSTTLPSEASIFISDFSAFAEAYSGPKFNFIHCDFPYGANLFGGKQSGRETSFNYSDTKDDYFSLLEALAKYSDKLISPSAHILFWFSMDYYSETFDFLSKNLPFKIHKRPLIWQKTCNSGIIPDPKRQPRWTAETAFFGSAEDRFIVKPVASCYGGPINRELHPSCKPVPMLSHFFQMFVDESTRMLDPTCGSGSSIRAAEGLGAELVIGVERDQEIATAARNELTKFRLLRGK